MSAECIIKELSDANDKLLAVLVWSTPRRPGFWSAFYGGKIHQFPCRETAVQSVILYGESLLEVEAEERQSSASLAASSPATSDRLSS